MLLVDVGLCRGVDVLLPRLGVGRLGDSGELDLLLPNRVLGLLAGGISPINAPADEAGQLRTDKGNVAQRAERQALVKEDDAGSDDQRQAKSGWCRNSRPGRGRPAPAR